MIIGINGQIGSYLSEILNDKSYKIFGIARSIGTLQNVTYKICDICNTSLLRKIITEIMPDEIYNMAAQSDAVISVEQPEETMIVNAIVVTTLCELARQYKIKLFQAGSMEIYKGIKCEIIDETAETFYPVNPYGIAKLGAYWSVRYYREQKNCYVCTGIIFNAESPRRNEKFITRKVINGVKKSLVDPNYVLSVGNIDSKRDWIHAYDVAMAAWKILQQDKPGDYMICLGTNHSVREFIEKGFAKVGITIEWIGNSMDEIGIDTKSKRKLVQIDPKFFRTYESQTTSICGNNTKLLSIGWVPKYTLDDIINDLF